MSPFVGELDNLSTLRDIMGILSTSPAGRLIIQNWIRRDRDKREKSGPRAMMMTSRGKYATRGNYSGGGHVSERGSILDSCEWTLRAFFRYFSRQDKHIFGPLLRIFRCVCVRLFDRLIGKFFI
jgi:hypothetical protein